MTLCGVCTEVELVKHYKDLGVCAKCHKDQTRTAQKQCSSCLDFFAAVVESSSDLCGQFQVRKVHIDKTRPELVVKKFLENDTELPPVTKVTYKRAHSAHDRASIFGSTLPISK